LECGSALPLSDRAKSAGAPAYFKTIATDIHARKFPQKRLGQYFFGPLASAPIRGVKMLRRAIGPGLIAGVMSIFASCFSTGVNFRHHHRRTAARARPQRSRPFLLAGFPAGVITDWSRMN
jgi:hypothetical protein